jgi:glycosyltransferase involved in cell wall biosynthesis
VTQPPVVSYVVGATDGGTGRHVAMLVRGSAAAGLSVTVFGPAGIGDLLGPANQPAARFAAVAIGDRPRPASDAAVVRRLRRSLTGADVVHAHGLRAGAQAALALRSAGGKRPALIVTVHNAPPGGTGAAAVYGLLERLVARSADVVLCVSSDLAARMRRRGAREVARAIVPSGAGRAAGRRPADLTDDGRPLVLAAGRLAPQKGFGTLIDAASRWRDLRPQPLLIIAGAGPLAGELAGRARHLGVDVRLPGRRDDIPDLLAAADVFALPSRWEGQPLILQEALMAGRPIVATDVGGVRDLTGDDAAVLVSPDDPAAFAAAVRGVLDDPGLAARLSKAAAGRAAALPTEADAITAALELYSRYYRSTLRRNR